MQPIWIRKSILLFVLLGVAAVSAQAEESPAARSARLKREFELKSQQMKKDFEKLKKQNSAAAKSTNSARTKSSEAVQFDAQSAPRPEVCFDAFLQAARSAKSFEEILPYLPADKRDYYQREQKLYDPERARERRLRYEKEGKLDADAILHLTQPPYDTGLKSYRGMALKVNEFVSVTTTGDRATLHVTIHINETIDGVRYTKSTASIGMIGEGDSWKFESFKEGLEARR